MEAKEKGLLLDLINNLFAPIENVDKDTFYVEPHYSHISNIMEYDYISTNDFQSILKFLWDDKKYCNLITVITVAVFKEHEQAKKINGKISEYIYEF